MAVGTELEGRLKVVVICAAEFAKEDSYRLGSVEGEPCVGAVIRELARQRVSKGGDSQASFHFQDHSGHSGSSRSPMP